MGLTTLPKVGAGEALGVVKQDRPLELIPENRKILATEWNANAGALEAVCDEVGLHDGSTPGSLVERVIALEAGGGGGTGDVTGPASAVLGHIATFDNVSGKVIGDSGIDVVAIATAQAAADAAQDTADSKVSGPVTTIVSNVMSWNSTDGTVSKDSGIPQTFILHGAIGSGVSTFSSASVTLADSSNRGHVIVDTTTIGGNCTITVPHDLTPQVRVDLRVKGAFGIVLAVTGGIALTYHGWTQGATITGDGTRVEIIIESTTVAHVYVYPPGVTAEALDALYPLVQSAHTSSTKTLAAGDAGDIIPLNAASNAIAVTIPHTLFAAGGTGRAWSCGFYVTSVAGGAVTFTGSGGIVIKYFGKKPSATAIAAGDTIFVTVVSATLAHVWISAEIP